MVERLILGIFLLAQAISFYLEFSSLFLRRYRAEQKLEFILQLNNKDYLVRLEENPPALKVATLETSDSNQSFSPASHSSIAKISLPGSSVFPESLAHLMACLQKPATTTLTRWELLSMLFAGRRFLSPTEIFYYEPPDKRQQEEFKLLWQNPLPKKSTPQEPIYFFEVLNATDEAGLALRFGRHLRRKLPFFDVISFGNAAPQKDNSSFLLVYKGNLHVAKRILLSLNRVMALNLKNRVACDPHRGVDFGLVLGSSAKEIIPRLAYFDLLGE